MQFPLDFIEILHALTLHRVNFLQHHTPLDVCLIDLVIQSLVHGFLGFAEPSQQIRMLFHLLLEIFKIEIFFFARKLLEYSFNVPSVQSN